MEEIVISEYKSEYETKVKKFLIEICINEFGYEEWRKELELDNKKNIRKMVGIFG